MNDQSGIGSRQTTYSKINIASSEFQSADGRFNGIIDRDQFGFEQNRFDVYGLINLQRCDSRNIKQIKNADRSAKAHIVGIGDAEVQVSNRTTDGPIECQIASSCEGDGLIKLGSGI